MAFFDQTNNLDNFLELESSAGDFLARSRILSKQRKNWSGRKMPSAQRDKKNAEKEAIESIPRVPLLKLKKGNDLMELTETANGVEIPSEIPVATHLFFYCEWCGYGYNDPIKHAKECKGPRERKANFKCPHCKQFDSIVTHDCKAPIERRPEFPWLATEKEWGKNYGKTDWDLISDELADNLKIEGDEEGADNLEMEEEEIGFEEF